MLEGIAKSRALAVNSVTRVPLEVVVTLLNSVTTLSFCSPVTLLHQKWCTLGEVTTHHAREPTWTCVCRTSSSIAPLPGVGLGAVDIQETPNAYLFKVDVPGLSKDDVKGALLGLLVIAPCILAGLSSCIPHCNDVASIPWKLHVVMSYVFLKFLGST